MNGLSKVFLFLFILFSENILAQSLVLEQYIKESIASHPTIKQHNFQLEKGILMLDEAKGLFLPTVNFNTTYSTAAGGRSIAFPVGDLINPIYATLNKLTPVGAQKFPEGAVPNVNEQLVPKNFYDMRLKTQMPLFNTEIKYNQKIKKAQIGLQEAEIQVFKRELVKDIKIAYFNYLKALKAINIYENAKILLKETERVNRSLIKNEMANPMALIKTQNEQAKVEAEAINAANNQRNAKAYFNFLTNRNFEDEIIVDTTLQSQVFASIPIEMGKREELLKLESAIKVNELILEMNKSYKKPKIGGILDVGSQGGISNINSKNTFALFGLSFDMPIYAGNRNQLKIKEQQIELLALNEQDKQLKNQLQLQAEISKNSFLASREILAAKQIQVETAQRYYNDVLKKYKEGQINYVELFEAQTQVLNSQLQKNIGYFDSWIRFAELERANASFDF